jgi:hypothetical protein
MYRPAPQSQRLKAVSNADAKALAVLDAADLPELRAAFINLAIPYDEWETAEYGDNTQIAHCKRVRA